MLRWLDRKPLDQQFLILVVAVFAVSLAIGTVGALLISLA